MHGKGDGERKQRTFRQTIPVGLEQVLFLAASDEGFRAALEKDRRGALERWGLRLRDSELGLLSHIPGQQLRANISGVDTSAPNLERRDFLRAVAASVAALAAGPALSGCVDEDGDGLDGGVQDLTIKAEGVSGDMGHRNDKAPPPDMTIVSDQAMADMGSRDITPPDMPPPDVDQPDSGTDLLVDVHQGYPDCGIKKPDSNLLVPDK